MLNCVKSVKSAIANWAISVIIHKNAIIMAIRNKQLLRFLSKKPKKLKFLPLVPRFNRIKILLNNIEIQNIHL